MGFFFATPSHQGEFMFDKALRYAFATLIVVYVSREVRKWANS